MKKREKENNSMEDTSSVEPRTDGEEAMSGKVQPPLIKNG
jgi:hypothetical protein